MTRRFEDIVAWQKAHQFVVMVYRTTRGSLEECRYYCILAKDLSYIDESTYQQLVQTILDTSYMLNAYLKGVIDNNSIQD